MLRIVRQPDVAGLLIAATCAAVLAPCATSAEEAPAPAGWTARAALNGVTTSGNTSTQSLGFKGRLAYEGHRNKWSFEASGLRKRDVQVDVFAFGSADEFRVASLDDSTTTAESYAAETSVERQATSRMDVNAAGSWRRDLFSGIEYLLSARGGVGYELWKDPTRGELRGLLQATVNTQQDSVPNPSTDRTFVGLRVGYGFHYNFGSERQSTIRSQLDLDENMQDTEDFRANWENSLTVAMNHRLALQVAAEQKYRHQPALREVALYPEGASPGIDGAIGRVVTPFEKLDSILTVALVVNWGPKPAKEALPK